jgi:VWFA-related protein
MRLASLALLLAVAQATGVPPPADLVRIDVIVTDSRGRAVESLRSTDFDLREDGAPQTLAGAQLVRNPRLVGIYLDEYFVSAANTASVRNTLHRFVDLLSPDDKAVILRPLDSLLTIRLTQDREALHAAIEAFEGRRGDYTPRTAFERNYIVSDRARADEQRAQSTWSTLNALTLHLANLGAGRSSVLFVSEQADPIFHRRGFEGLPTSSSVTRAANRSSVSIYVFDPRDAKQRASNPDEGPNLLRVLADDTDGALLSGPETIDAGLRAMLNDASSYYLLSYRSERSRDGLFHTVDVLVKPAGMKVRARRGYWAPTPDEVQRANMLAHASDPLPPLKVLPARHVSRLIQPWFGTSRGDNGKTRVTFVWEPAGIVPGDRHVKIPARVDIKAVGSDGTTAFEGVVGERASAVFDVPPGRTALTMSIEDAASNAIDSDVRDIIVRDLKGNGLLLGTPQVFRARNARDRRELTAEPAAVPVAARDFSRAEHLVIRVPAYASSAPTLIATLISPAKQAMRQLEVEPVQNNPGVTQIDVPLAGLVPGQYSVEIAAKSPTGAAKEAVAFRVSD